MGIAAGVREDRNTVERAARGNDAAGAKYAASRLQADQIVESCGNAPRSRCIGAERKRDQIPGDGYRRTRAGTAGNVALVEDARTGPVRGAHTHQSGGELVHVGLADEDRAGLLEPGHRGGRRHGRIAEPGASGGGRHAFHVEIIFDGKGYAIERECACRWAALECARSLQSDLTRNDGDPDRPKRLGLDAVVDRGDDFGGFMPRSILLVQRREVHTAASGRRATRDWPADTRVPEEQYNLSTVPALGATTAISIFIASNTINV